MNSASLILDNKMINHTSGIPFFTERSIGHISKNISLINYSTCEHLWSYLGKMALITRSFLNGVARSLYFVCRKGVNFADRIKNITTHMKLLSIVGVVFSIFDLKAAAQRILKNALWNDREGIALSAISFTIIASDILDSITTFVNATLAVICRGSVALFSKLGLPLGFIMAGLGTVSRTVQIAKSMSLYKKIDQAVFLGKHLNKKLLKGFLEETLGISSELKSLLSSTAVSRLTEANKARILRAAPAAVIKDFEMLLAMVEESSDEELFMEEHKQVEEILKNIQKHLKKKMLIDGSAIVANSFVLSALILFAIGTSGALPFLLLALAHSVRLSLVIYQDRNL